MSLTIVDDLRIVPNVSRVHSSAICFARQIRIPRQPAEAVEVRQRQVVAEPVGVAADVRHADEPAGRVARTSCPRRGAFTGVPRRRLTCMSKSSTSFHIGTRKHRVPLLAEVLLRDLQLDRLVRLLERAEQRRRRLAHLEVDRPVLDLDDDVVVELAVERR